MEGKLLSNTNQNTSHMESQEQGTVIMLNFIFIASISLTVLGTFQYHEKWIKTMCISIKIRYKSINNLRKSLVN